jgi:predicted enzyme related to lactoylglutathione lyase
MLLDSQVTFIYTRDLPAASAFLREKLGLTLALNQFDLCHIYRVAGTSYLGVCVNREPPAESGLTYSFVTTDVDATYALWKGRGVEFDGPPEYSRRFNVYSCFFRGIGPYRFELQAFRDPAWPG